MKVLFNTYPVAFAVPGGGEMQLMAYYRHLSQQGVTPVLFDQWKPRFEECDIVHFFSVMGGSGNFCGYVKYIGLPLVVTSSLWITEETRHLYPYDEIRAQLAIADKVITNSNIEGDQLAAVFDLPREKFSTVYNGIDEEFLARVDPDLFHEKVSVPNSFILNVGNIEPRKNQLMLIRAIKSMPQEKLVLIGQVRDRAYAEKCFQEGGDQVCYCGVLPHDGPLLRAAMAACGVFVLPSTLETPGLAALEAAAQGAQLVITEIGSTREYFGDKAIYISPTDPMSIAGGIAKARRMTHDGEALKKLIAERFLWPKTLPPLVAIYKNLVSKTEKRAL